MTGDEIDVDGRQSAAGNAALSLVSQVLGAVFTAGLTVFITRRLGTHGYGLLTLALGIAGLAMLPADFGVSYSVVRFIADHREDRPRLQAVMADALRLKTFTAVFFSALLFALAPAISRWYHVSALVWPVRAASFYLFGQSMMSLNSVFTSLRRVDLQLRTVIAESAVQCTAAVALVLAGAGAAGAAFGWAIGYLFGGAMTIVMLVRLLGPQIVPRGLRFGDEARRVGRYAGVLLVVEGAFTVFNQVDVLTIGAILGASSVGIFSAPMQLVSFLNYPGLAVASGVAPRLSRVASGGPDVKAFVIGLRVMFIVQAAIAAFVAGWAGLFVHVALGHQYAHSVNVLRALAPFVFLNGLGALVSISANFLGEASSRLPVAITTVVLNISLDLFLVPRIGVIGAAIGTDAAYLLYAPAHLYICRQAMRFDLRPTALTCTRTLLAGGCMVGVLLLFGDSIAVSQLSRTVLGGVVATAVYGAVLVVTGEVGREEFRLVRPARWLSR